MTLIPEATRLLARPGERVLAFTAAGAGGRSDTLARLADVVGGSAEGDEGLAELAAIDAAMQTAEHEAGVARLTEFRDMLEEELGSLADDGRGLFPNGGLDAAPDAPADAPVDKAFKVPRTADGALLFKAFPKGPPIRFRLADLRPAEPKQMTKADDAKAVRVSRELDRAAKRRAALGY